MAQNSLDKIPGLGLSLGGGMGAERGTPTGSAGGKDECPDRRGKNTGQIIRHREDSIVAAEGEKWRGGASPEKKMLIIDEGSRNVYENKQKDDNLPEEKGDISTQRNKILYRNIRCQLKPSGFLPLYGALGNEPRTYKTGPCYTYSQG